MHKKGSVYAQNCLRFCVLALIFVPYFMQSMQIRTLARHKLKYRTTRFAQRFQNTAVIPNSWNGMERPKVGVGVLIVNGNRILLGKRRGAHGEGCWAPPGGHLEFGESWETCAQREVLEETGLTIAKPWFYGVTNDVFHESNKHYITIFMHAQYAGGTVQNCEPEKCEGWEWFVRDRLPDKLFLPLANLMNHKRR
jgi:8-oxo-dGTP diphosphatase